VFRSITSTLLRATSQIVQAQALNQPLRAVQAVRFSSDEAANALADLCQLPRINAAMKKEHISVTQLSDTNLYYLEQFEKNDHLFSVYNNGHLSFAHYALATKSKQDHILRVLEFFNHVDEAIAKKHIDLHQHAEHIERVGFRMYLFPFRRVNYFNLFNPKFTQLFLDTKLISVDQYIQENKLPQLYALSALCSETEIETYLQDGLTSIDKLLTLDSQALCDLASLFSNEKWNAHRWFQEDYLSIDLFLQCEPNDRQQYLRFMWHKKIPCENFTLAYFLSLTPSTRQYIRFDQAYITPEAFNKLSSELQKSISNILFSITGLYAMRCNFISIEQFCALSPGAQTALSVLFYDAQDEYWELRNVQKNIEQLFANGFDFKSFSALADQSEKSAVEYLLYGQQQDLRPSMKL